MKETEENYIRRKCLERLKDNPEAGVMDFQEGIYAGIEYDKGVSDNEPTADYIDRHIVEAMVEVAKQKVYSEEEVINIIYKIYDDMGISISLEDVLEQFKKK